MINVGPELFALCDAIVASQVVDIESEDDTTPVPSENDAIQEEYREWREDWMEEMNKRPRSLQFLCLEKIKRSSQDDDGQFGLPIQPPKQSCVANHPS